MRRSSAAGADALLSSPNLTALFLLYSAALLLFPSPAAAQTTVVTTTAVAAQPSLSPDFVQDDLFQKAILNSTNFYRSEHNATALTWNASLASFGANWVQACNFAHSGGPDGENLAEGYANVSAAVDAWGDERASYDYANPGFSEQTGHFTQLVWLNTSTVGCGRKYCAGQNGLTGWYLTCEYWPRGNVIGEFQQEVQRQVNGTVPSGGGGGGSSGGSGGSSGGGGGGDCVQGAVCNAAAATAVLPGRGVAVPILLLVVALVGFGGEWWWW